MMNGKANAQRWDGQFTISPVSAPDMALEAVDAGASEGTVVSIGKPSGLPSQKWIIQPKGDNTYVIKPSYSSTLVMAVADAGVENGSAIILQTEMDKPSQLWSIQRNYYGSFCLVPEHAPEKGLDDFGGNKNAGAKIDIWDYNADDEHLQWRITPLSGAKYPVYPEVIAGRIEQAPFTESAIYPGTKRSVTVFIPAQYDGSKPACVFVQQDGYNPSEKPILETLIADKEMPVTIGVFVTPGDMPSYIPNSMARRNRGFEYDSVGDRYVRFLLEEIFPFVEKKFGLKLSNSGNDRCIVGGSSGGIAAFNAAWQRPDAFTRVYSNSGSFVAFRGGNEFPTMIRKFEAKPIRAYLTTGTDDMENCAGDWNLLNQEMDKSLKFSGYDYFFRIIKGPHVAGWNKYFPEAMRYIWKGWPAPVIAGSSAPRVQDVIIPGQSWELASSGYHDVRGPACNSKGEVFFIDDNRIFRIGVDGKVDVYLSDAEHANGLSFGPKGELYTVSRVTGKVMVYYASGKGKVYASGIHGEYVLAMPGGGIYITEEKGQDSSNIWFVKDGKKSIVGSGIKHATGLAYRPDQWLLSVADGDSKWVYSYQINPNGTLANKERFFWLYTADWDDNAGSESVCYAREGEMLTATRSGIQISADDGPVQVILPMPDRSRVNGVCFGGADMNTLYAFCEGKVYKRAVKIHGIGAFTPWIHVNGTPL
jgi:enterochelin esterase-like enzyme/sugar lactone lactonase YvrE